MARSVGSHFVRRLISLAAAVPLAVGGLATAAAITARPAAALPPPIGLTSITPVRAVDTRGTPFGPLPLLAGESRRVRIAGIGGAPASAVAVALNVTVVDPGGDGYLTVYPSNVPQPLASNLNFVYSQNVANMVTTAVGPDGDIIVFNGANGTAHIIVDIAGWYAAGFHPVTPTRLLDTRATGGTLASGDDRAVVVGGQAGVPPTATAVILNVTSVNAGSPGYLTVYPTGVPRPTTSNLNYIPGLVVPTMVTVGLGSGGSVQMFSGDGGTDLVVDVAGWFDSGFHPLTPARIVDTRSAQCGTRIGPGETRYVQVAGRGGVPATTGAVSLTVTALDPTEPTFLTVWPADQPQPTASNLNTIGGVVPNMVTTGLSPNGRVAVYNAAGTTELLLDVTGWYDSTGPALGTTAGCQTAGLGAGVTAVHPAPAVDNVGMSGVALTPLRFGQAGPLVSNLQARLYSLGYWVADFDGNYGAVTSQAVMAFQKYNNLVLPDIAHAASRVRPTNTIHAAVNYKGQITTQLEIGNTDIK